MVLPTLCISKDEIFNLNEFNCTTYNASVFRRGLIKQFCPVKKGASHDLLRPLIPPAPIRSDDLPAEYIFRHRDSDYQFTQEFEVCY